MSPRADNGGGAGLPRNARGAGSVEPADAADEVQRLKGEVELRAERIRILSDELRRTRSELARARQDAQKARRSLAKLRKRRMVRLMLAVASRLRPILNLARRGRSVVRKLTRTRIHRPAPKQQKRVRATAAEEATFRARLAATLRPSATTTGPLVSAIVVTHNGIDHLRRLLPTLDRLAYERLEVVIVDNGSADASVDYVQSLTTRYPIQVVRNPDNRSFSEANNQGAAVANGEYLLLINNDVAPAGPHVLGHMVDRLLEDPTVVGVASRLIYPRREGPRMGSLTAHADLDLQHRGVAFVTWDGIPVARNVGVGEDPLGPAASERREVPVGTAACLLVRRAAFEEVGGFTLGYDYGTEDVDLGVKLRHAGGRFVYEPQATFWHHESATQHREGVATRSVRQRANRERFGDLWGPQVFREVFLDRLAGGGRWADGPLHVAITVTRNDPRAGFGDWYTGHELGAALEQLGWRVSYLERWQDAWYQPDTSVDVVIALLDAFDVRRLPEGMVTVAWVRNWTERWIERPWFDEYDIVLASSERSRELIDERSTHVSILMPLATNPERFRPPTESGAPDSVTPGFVADSAPGATAVNGASQAADAAPGPASVDIVFVGSRWGEDRRLQQVLPALAARGRTVALHGTGWETVPELAALSRGPVDYDDLPALYGSAAIVLDDTASSTRPYGAVNSRVFDALAAGSLVVTDNPLGARELFGGALPSADEPAELVELVERYLADPAERRRQVARLRTLVLEQHTYALRATQLRDVLRDWTEARRIDVAIGAPNWDAAPGWGDYWFGRSIQRVLKRRGHPTRVRLRDDWEGPAAARADVALQLFGLAPRRTRPGQISAVWIISHPELVTDELVEANDVVFVASDPFAATLAERTGREIVPLHQATDPERFRPIEGGPPHELLFVANSRGVRRRVVDDLTPTDLDFAVYGRGWKPELLDPRYLRGEHVPNQELAAYYAAAKVVLNDHWPDMAEHGFLSNRLYDASASGAFVISDSVPGIEEEFDGGVPAFVEGTELRELIHRFLADPAARAEHAARARRAVLERHTFAHRAEAILGALAPLLEARAARVTVDADTAGSPLLSGTGGGGGDAAWSEELGEAGRAAV